MKHLACRLGLALTIIGLLLSALWVILYAELCPNDPECFRLGWTDWRFVSMTGVGTVMYLWGRRA